ncbi:MAG: hypothetical protein U0232_05925 [Thermomicrobiales bacterium]
MRLEADAGATGVELAGARAVVGVLGVPGGDGGVIDGDVEQGEGTGTAKSPIPALRLLVIAISFQR